MMRYDTLPDRCEWGKFISDVVNERAELLGKQEMEPIENVIMEMLVDAFDQGRARQREDLKKHLQEHKTYVLALLGELG